MVSCSAGECSCECGPGKGCGCIALSDSPNECECHCYGGRVGGGLTLGLNAWVSVSISGLPLYSYCVIKIAAVVEDSIRGHRMLSDGHQ